MLRPGRDYEVLLRRAQRDQSTRRATSTEEGGLDDIGQLDLDNSRWLAAVVDDCAWAGRDLVGDDGAPAAWLLAHHGAPDPIFQRRCLDQLSKAIARAEASPARLAYLSNPVQLKELGYQDLRVPVPGGCRY
jgi:hypothetical protein